MQYNHNHILVKIKPDPEVKRSTARTLTHKTKGSTYTSTYAHTNRHTQTDTHINTHQHTPTHTNAHNLTQTDTHTYKHTSTHQRTQSYTNAHKQTQTHTPQAHTNKHSLANTRKKYSQYANMRQLCLAKITHHPRMMPEECESDWRRKKVSY